MPSRIRQLHRQGLSTLADDDGIRTAYAAHGSELYRFAMRALGDVGESEDVLQETFLKAWKAAQTYDAELSSLRVWLFAIARNVIVDHARRRAAASWPIVSAEEDGVEVALDPVGDATDQMLSTWLVESAVAKLSEEHRHVIIETYLRGRSYAEVALERGVPTGTLRSRTYYALKALRMVMDESGVTP